MLVWILAVFLIVAGALIAITGVIRGPRSYIGWGAAAFVLGLVLRPLIDALST